MNGNPRANGSRGHDPYAALRLVALIAAITGVIVLAAAAFVLSYGGIHKIALSAGVSASMARIVPVIFDAMLVVSCAAVLSLRAANWWHRAYAWLTALVLLAAVAAADAVHATGTHIPRKPAAATIAVLPWVLLLLAFSLLLSMLRQFRRARTAEGGQDGTGNAALAAPGPGSTAPESREPGHTGAGHNGPGIAGAGHNGPGTAGSGAASRAGLDILERRAPSPQPVHTRTATQPSAALPARTAVDTVPARESAPTALPAAQSRPAQSRPAQSRPAQSRPAQSRPRGHPVHPHRKPPRSRQARRPRAQPPRAPRPPTQGTHRGRSPGRTPGQVPLPGPMGRARLPLKSSRNEHLYRPPGLAEARSSRRYRRAGSRAGPRRCRASRAAGARARGHSGSGRGGGQHPPRRHPRRRRASWGCLQPDGCG